MQKRGQVYILVSIVIAMVIFGLVSIVNHVSQENLESDFEDLSDNYAKESSKLINAFIADPTIDISSAFINFTLLFTSYAKTINPKFGLIYAFYYNDQLYLGNYLDKRINVLCDGCARPSTIDGCFETIPATVDFGGLDLSVIVYSKVINQCNLTLVKGPDFDSDPEFVEITVQDVPYSFRIRPGHPEIIIVSWESRAEQRKVFTEGNFVENSESNPITLNNVCERSAAGSCDQLICQSVAGNCVVKCSIYENEEDCNIDQSHCAWSAEACQNVQ